MFNSIILNPSKSQPKQAASPKTPPSRQYCILPVADANLSSCHMFQLESITRPTSQRRRAGTECTSSRPQGNTLLLTNPSRSKFSHFPQGIRHYPTYHLGLLLHQAQSIDSHRLDPCHRSRLRGRLPCHRLFQNSNQPRRHHGRVLRSWTAGTPKSGLDRRFTGTRSRSTLPQAQAAMSSEPASGEPRQKWH